MKKGKRKRGTHVARPSEFVSGQAGMWTEHRLWASIQTQTRVLNPPLKNAKS